MLYTLKEAAKRLNISYSTICQLKRSGDLAAIIIGPRTIRIHTDDLNEYIKKHRQREIPKCPSTKGTELGKYRLVTLEGALEERLGKTRQSAKH